MKVAKKLKTTKYCWICPTESEVGSKNFNNRSNIIRMNDERTRHRAGCAKKQNGIENWTHTLVKTWLESEMRD